LPFNSRQARRECSATVDCGHQKLSITFFIAGWLRFFTFIQCLDLPADRADPGAKGTRTPPKWFTRSPHRRGRAGLAGGKVQRLRLGGAKIKFQIEFDLNHLAALLFCPPLRLACLAAGLCRVRSASRDRAVLRQHPAPGALCAAAPARGIFAIPQRAQR